MAIIYTYGYDSNINGADALIGTDSTGKKTKQFKVSDLTDYVSENIAVVAGVNSVTTTDSTFISLTPSTPTNGDVTITSTLSATGTPDETTFLRGDNTWATVSTENTTYDLASLQNVDNVNINLTGSDASVDTVTLVAGTNITLTDDGSNNITIDAADTTSSESDFVYFTVKNETGVTINKGKAVMAVGTDGNSGHILIDEMVADGSVEPKYFLGVLETSVGNGEFARVISFGQLDQFNTNGQNGDITQVKIY